MQLIITLFVLSVVKKNQKNIPDISVCEWAVRIIQFESWIDSERFACFDESVGKNLLTTSSD